MLLRLARGFPVRPLAKSVRGLQTFDVLDSQVNILRNGKTVVSQGTGGRSSRSGYTVTVFGAPGYVGTALVTKLGKHGTITVAPYREEMFQRHLKVTGDLGVVNYAEFDIRNVDSIERAVKHSDVVVNLMGRDWETKNFSFYDVHVEGAKRVAEAVAKWQVPRFIHVSSHTPDINSPSKFYATKALGESAVREIVPDATIVRPAPVFGENDNLLVRLASHDVNLVTGNALATLEPTHVLDLTRALEMMVYDDSTVGKTYDLRGPDKFTYSQLHDLVKECVKRDIQMVNLPKSLLKAWATFCQYAAYWEGPMTPDVVERMLISQPKPEKGTLGYSDLGITPQRLEDHVVHITRHLRASVFLHDSAETDKRRKKEDDSWSNIID